VSPKLLSRTVALAAVLSLAAAGTASAKGQGDQPFDDARTSGRVLFAITDQNQLIRFNSNNPDRLKDVRALTGLNGATLQGIDFRPATGDLYGVGSTATGSVVFRINPRTGIAVPEAPEFTPALNGRFFGFDFNPTVDKIRVTSDAGISARLNVDEGTLLANDPALNPGMPRVVGSAYANSSFTATKPAATVLYAIDSASDTLSVQNPMTSTLTTVRRLPFDIQDQAGFDIAGSDNVGYIATRARRGSALYTVDPVTGKSRFSGQIGGGRRLVVTGLAAWQD
jgi:Domain of unknown function (DUF4394)